MKSFSVKDFAGGLVTSKEPELLEPNQSPDLSNVDLLYSGAIRSRKGYTSANSESFTSGKIDALHRHYSTDGTVKRWFAVTGTQAFSYDGTTQYWKRVEAESVLAASNGTYTILNSSVYSGGKAIQMTASTSNIVSLDLPKCTQFKMNVGTASLRIDGGSWIQRVYDGSPYTSSTLSATQHTVDVKINNVTDYRCVVTANTTPYPGLGVAKYIYRTVNQRYAGHPKSPSIKFYDNGSDVFAVTLFKLFTGDNLGFSRIEVIAIGSSYILIDRSTDTSTTLRSRSVGWHTIEFRFSWQYAFTIYIDGVYTGYANNVDTYPDAPYADVTGVGLSIGSADNIPSMYFTKAIVDKYSEDGTIVDEFNDVSQWSLRNSPSVAIEPHTDFAPTTTIDYFDYIDGTLWSKVDNTLSASTDQFGITSFMGKVYYASPYDTLRVMTQGGTSSAVSGTQYAGGFLLQHKSRLWLTGSADQYNTLVRISRVENPSDWITSTAVDDAAQANAAGADSAQVTTGLVVFNDEVHQFTNVGVYKYSTEIVSGDTTSTYLITPKTLSNRYGCIAPKSLSVAPNTLVWLGSDAVYTYGVLAGVNPLEGGAFGILSDDISDLIASIPDKTKPVGIIYDQKYWLACDLNGDGKNSSMLIYRFPDQATNRPGAWTRYDYASLDISCMYRTRGDEDGLYVGTTDGDIVKLDEGYNDGGSAFYWYYDTPPLAPGSYANVKNFRVSHISGKSDSTQTVYVDMDTDDVSPSSQVVEMDESTSGTPFRLLTPSRGRYIKARLSATSENQETSMSSLTITYVESPMR